MISVKLGTMKFYDMTPAEAIDLANRYGGVTVPPLNINTFTVEKGHIAVSWPSSITEDDAQDAEEFFSLCVRCMKRVAKQNTQALAAAGKEGK